MASVGQVFSKIGGVLGAIAPTIATALGGPLAGAAVGAVAKAITGDPKTDPSAVEQQIIASTDPATYAALKKADQEFAEQMRQMDIDVEKISQADRASARDREVAVKDWTPRVLAYLVTGGFFGLMYFFLFHSIPAESRDSMNQLLGMLATAWVAIMTYYFGSSAGSARKTEIMNKGTSEGGK